GAGPATGAAGVARETAYALGRGAVVVGGGRALPARLRSPALGRDGEDRRAPAPRSAGSARRGRGGARSRRGAAGVRPRPGPAPPPPRPPDAAGRPWSRGNDELAAEGFGVDGRRRRPAFEHGQAILDRQARHLDARLVRGAADVRGEDDV